MKQAQKSLVTAGGLLVVAGAVLGAALWVNRDVERQEKQKEDQAKLFAFDKAKVRSVRLEKGKDLVAEAVRDENGKPWRLVKPVQADADDATVNAIVDKLAELKQKKDLGGDTDPKQPGLDAPRFKVTLALDDKKEHGIEVGADNPFDSSMYVRKLGEKTVRIVEGWHKTPLDKSTFDLRDRRVARIEDAAEVRSASVTNDNPYTLVKSGADWKLTGPGHETPEAADSSTADRVVSTLKNLRATAVAAEGAFDEKKFGLHRPKVAVEIDLAVAGGKDTFRRKLAIGEATSKVYARRDDAKTVFEVDKAVLKDLAKDWFELQDKTVAKFDREQVRMLEIEAPGAAKVAVSRRKDAPPDGGYADEKFAVEAPASGAAKRWKISSALYSLASLKAAAFATGKPKLDKPRVYTVKGEKDAVLARITVGGPLPKNDKRLYVMAEGKDRVYEVEKATLDDLPKTLDDVLDTPPPAAADGGTAAPQAKK